jgi:DNA modification methylase
MRANFKKEILLNDMTLLLGDCVEVIKNMADKSVDLVFADPPFNIGKKYGGISKNDKRDDYYDWCGEWICECFRV